MGFFFFILLLFLFLALAIVGTVVNFFVKIFSFGRKSKTAGTDDPSSSTATNSGGKVFTKDEGEYVDFEEVKE